MKGKKRTSELIGITAVAVGCIVLLFSAACGHTAEVVGTDGNPIELAIDRMRPLQVNGTEQGIYESGADRDNPVLLWLDGGPGGTEVGWVRKYLGPLHSHFTIVCWDQRGSGKARKLSIPMRRFGWRIMYRMSSLSLANWLKPMVSSTYPCLGTPGGLLSA